MHLHIRSQKDRRNIKVSANVSENHTNRQGALRLARHDAPVLVHEAELLHAGRGEEADKGTELGGVVQELDGGGAAVEDAHAARADDGADRVQLRPVNVPVVLAVLEKLVARDVGLDLGARSKVVVLAVLLAWPDWT